MSCIFCNRSTEGASENHILPASLGGAEWACLPDGLVCSNCNQYFGDKVEKLALGSWPFLVFRIMLGIPTRKGLPPKMETRLGTIKASREPGRIGIDPISPEIEQKINEGEITQLHIVAEPSEPLAVCRMLVKMGLEVVASDSADDARSATFNSARIFARNPPRGMEWWFCIYTDHDALFAKFRRGVSLQEWVEGVSLSVHQFVEFEAFRLQLLDMIIFTPLDGRVIPPDLMEFPEPDYRLFRVKN